MLLGEQVIWAQLTRALSVLSLSSAVIPVTVFTGLAHQTTAGRDFSAPTLPVWFCAPLPIQSNSQKGPVSCTHRLLQRDFYSGSGCDLYVGSPCSQTNLIQKMGRGVFFPTEFSESVKVKKKENATWIFLFTVSCFVSSFLVPHYHRGKPGLPWWCTYSIWRSDRRHGCIEDN